MTPIKISKGLDIPIAGKPAATLHEVSHEGDIAVYQEFEGLKAKLKVQEGDLVEHGQVLFIDKKQPDLQFCSPVAGTVKAIEYGARRALYRVIIEPSAGDQPVTFNRYTLDQLRGIGRDAALENLLASGLLSLIRQRPFSRIADASVTPKSIFVNAMNTAPFGPDINVAVQGREQALQAGVHILTQLTEGPVYLCLAPSAAEAVRNLDGAEKHVFEGPHPAGNTSVHIHHLDPMLPADQVWNVKAVDLIRIGELFLNGTLPTTSVVSLAGPGVQETARAHYRVPIGMPLSALLDGKLESGEHRIVKGNALAGVAMKSAEHVSAIESALTIIPESEEQYFMGWLAPGINKLSASRTYLSGWNGHKREWKLTTLLNGSYRSMVFTGLYDKYVPLNILVDYLVRAVLAHDTDEAISLGILETDPEDFALCSYVCPSKMDISGIIKQGLAEIEKEGI